MRNRSPTNAQRTAKPLLREVHPQRSPLAPTHREVHPQQQRVVNHPQLLQQRAVTLQLPHHAAVRVRRQRHLRPAGAPRC